MQKLAKDIYDSEEIANEGDVPSQPETKPKPSIKAVSVSEDTAPAPDMAEMGGGGDIEDMSLGTIKISSKDNPKVANWKLGKEYPMKVRMVGSDLDADKKTIIGEFEIVK